MRETMLDIINEYYLMNRQVGHTTAVMNGAKVSRPLILVGNRSQSDNIKQHDPGAEIVTLTSIGHLRRQLQGKRRPLVVDNVAWPYLVEDVRNAVIEMTKERLEQDNE